MFAKRSSKAPAQTRGLARAAKQAGSGAPRAAAPARPPAARKVDLWAAVDWKLKNTVGLAPERTVAPANSFDSGTVYWVTYARKGDSPNGGELYGAYKSEADAQKAVAEIKKWAANIDKDLAYWGVKKSDWQIDLGRIKVEKMGGPGKDTNAKADTPDLKKGSTPQNLAAQKKAAAIKALGVLSRSEETRSGDPGTVSPGYFNVKVRDQKGKPVRDPETGKIQYTQKPDPGGRSYGIYQLASQRGGPNGGNVRKFVDRYFPDVFKGLAVNSPEFIRKWVQTALADPEGFTDKQHDFIYRTHYLPVARSLNREEGLDLDTRSSTLRDVVWSTAVQHGQAFDIIQTALQDLMKPGQTPADVSDRDLIGRIYGERLERHPDYKKRYLREMGNALRALDREQGAAALP